MTHVDDAGEIDQQVDGLILWRRQGDPIVHRAVASGYNYSDLRDGGLLDHASYGRLEQVAEAVHREDRLCESQELLDAWLDAFEILASVHAEDFGGKRA
jgi:hypothetical protein